MCPRIGEDWPVAAELPPNTEGRSECTVRQPGPLSEGDPMTRSGGSDISQARHTSRPSRSLRSRPTSRATQFILSAPRWRLVLLFHLLAALPLVVLTWSVPRPVDGDLYRLCLLTTILAAWELWSLRRVAGTVFTLYGLFLVSALLFNAGAAFLEAFGLGPSNGAVLSGSFHFDNRTLFTTFLLAGWSLWCLHLGAIIGYVGMRVPSMPLSTDDLSSDTSTVDKASLLRAVGVALLIASVPATVIVVVGNIGTVASSGYAGIYQGVSATGLGAAPSVLASFFFPGALFLLAGSRERRASTVVSAILIGGYVTAELYLGHRSAAYLPLVAWLWVFHRCIRRINGYAVLLVGVLALTVVSPAIAATRLFTGSAHFDYGSALSSASNPATAAIQELGGSADTIAFTTALVPASRPYDLGASYLLSTLTLIPNVTGVQRGPDYDTWLIKAVDPATAATGGALGFSFVAEEYANFGAAGVLVSVVVGFFLVRFERWAGNDPAKLAAAGTYLAFVLFFPRAEIAYVLRPLFWNALAPLALVSVISRRRQAATKARPGRSSNLLEGAIDALPSVAGDSVR
jgi:oligosaccharide repeat unit polymerase